MLLKDERRYTGITLGFRSQGVEQFGREGREECSFGVRCFVVNGTESERGRPPFLCLAFVAGAVFVTRARLSDSRQRPESVPSLARGE